MENHGRYRTQWDESLVYSLKPIRVQRRPYGMPHIVGITIWEHAASTGGGLYAVSSEEATDAWH
eukprot:2107833-Amphidinium_carterae.1